MKRIFAVVLFAGAIALTLGIIWEAQTTASPPTCGSCSAACYNYCGKHNSFCQYASPICYNGDCGPGACSFICGSGETGSFSCDCTSCGNPNPGGSPIFKKQPTSPPS